MNLVSSNSDENQHLPFWGHGPHLEKRDPLPRRLSELNGLVPEWRKNRDQQADCCVDVDSVSVCHGEDGVERKGQARNEPVDPHSHAHLWPWAVGLDRKSLDLVQVIYNGFLFRVSFEIVSWQSRGFRWGSIGVWFEGSPRRLIGEVFWAYPTERRPQGRRRSR